MLTPLVASMSFTPASGLTFLVTQPQDTLSSPEILTIISSGGGPLEISSLTFSGGDPQDFIVSSNGCMELIPSGASCALGISFAPQAQGTRTATLQIGSNDPSSPKSVTLSGTGGSLPQRPPGATGTTGATGPRGPQGPAGKVELVSCRSVTTGKGKHKHKKAVRQCSTKLTSSPVKFTTAAIAAVVSRGEVVYARGSAAGAGRQTKLLLALTPLRKIRKGSYTLTLPTGTIANARQSRSSRQPLPPPKDDRCPQFWLIKEFEDAPSLSPASNGAPQVVEFEKGHIYFPRTSSRLVVY